MTCQRSATLLATDPSQVSQAMVATPPEASEGHSANVEPIAVSSQAKASRLMLRPSNHSAERRSRSETQSAWQPPISLDWR